MIAAQAYFHVGHMYIVHNLRSTNKSEQNLLYAWLAQSQAAQALVVRSYYFF